MKNIHTNFIISETLAERIDKAMASWGFATRAEFFRFCAIEFLRFDAEAISSDESLREYSRSIAGIRASKRLAKVMKR